MQFSRADVAPMVLRLIGTTDQSTRLLYYTEDHDAPTNDFVRPGFEVEYDILVTLPAIVAFSVRENEYKLS